MKIKLAILCNLLTVLCLSADAQGTAFTYQGQLQDHGSPANGTYDLVFALYNNSQAGSQVGLAETNYNVAVTNGLFTTTLDFGSLPFNGQLLWLDLSVRTNVATIYTGLTPRQQLTPVPYAIYAENVSASAISGTIQPASLAGTYGNAITMNNAGNSFSGNGVGLTGVNATALNGLNAANFWQLGGNNVLQGQFLGSTNMQSLELHAGNQRGLLITTNYSDSPNLVGGSPANLVDPGVRGAVIAGGGTTNYLLAASSNHINLSADFSSIGGGSGNTIQSGADHSLIGGGWNNVMGSFSEYSVIGGGSFNTNTSLYYGVIVGGDKNAIQGSQSAFLGGGIGNAIQANAPSSTLVGGAFNSIQQYDLYSFLGGGFTNSIQTNSGYAVLVGGKGNSLNGDNSVLVGGEGNLLLQNAHDSFLGGGRNNTNTAAYAFLGGGTGNAIQQNSDNSFLGGGAGNFIGTNASSSTIGGGTGNAIQQSANGSVLVGGEENAIQDGAYDSFIGGGTGNLIDTNAYSSTIGGGTGNWIMPDINGNTYGSVIGGGSYNTIEGDTSSAFIGGGAGNDVGINGNFATIPGGLNNYASGQYSFAAGQDAQATNDGAFVWADSQPALFASTNNDSFNVRAQGGVHFVTGGAGVTVDGQPIGGSIPGLTIQQNYAGAPNVILGSPLNFVQNGVVGATIGGGGALNYGDVAYSNNVMGDFGTVGGGIQNTASGQLATIGGGQGNVGSAGYATVGGGSGNLATNYAATVPGGSFNIAGGQFSFAAGLRAHATNNGAFVWADSQGPPFSSTSNDQFLIRAQGGLGINTNNPGGAALNVNGTVTATSLQGNGAVPWQVFSGTTLQAQPNTGYLLMNNTTPMVVTLPASPNIGDIVRISTASREGWGLAQNSGQSVLISSFAETLWRGWVFTNNVGTIVPLNWTGIAVSADGIKLVAVISGTGVRNVITSADSGRSWTFSSGAPALNWTAVASSSTGQNLVGVADSDGIYISSDWGATWEESKNAPNNDWIAVASSSTGVKLVAITASGQIFASINSGVVWSEKTNFPVTGLASVASSQDGSKLVAVGGGAVYTSGDSGLSWSSNALSSLPLNGVTSSSDGSKLVAVGDGGYIFTSSNAGASWSTNSMYNGVVGDWLSVASSGDGTKLIASCHADSNPPEYVVSYISDDSGITWGYQYHAEDTIEGSVASSASGNTRVSADHGLSSRIAIYQDSTSIGTSGILSVLGRETSAVELQYIGNGQFMPISHEGNFSFQ